MKVTSGLRCFVRVTSVSLLTLIMAATSLDALAIVASDDTTPEPVVPGRNVVLIRAQGNSGGIAATATGVLVGERHVLTVAHTFACFDSACNVTAQLKFGNSPGAAVPVTKIYIHRNFGRNEKCSPNEFDVAILELEAPLTHPEGTPKPTSVSDDAATFSRTAQCAPGSTGRPVAASAGDSHRRGCPWLVLRKRYLLWPVAA